MTAPEPADAALTALVEKLTLEQKTRLLTGADNWSLHAEPAVGLRRIVLSDGPSGVRGESWDGRFTALNLPSATALAASWDPGLARRYGAILAHEARRMGVDVVLGPTINLHRSPLGGRHFEAYAEDPLLTSRMAAAFVRGVQDGGVGATPKHYVANDAETDRLTVDNRVGERALRELYLAAFEDTVVRERPWMVMSAYNSVNGTTMTEHPLLAEPLCGEWGFDGVVVSDWWAVRSTEPAALARQDLVMPGPEGPWGAKLTEAVRAGRVPEAAVDEKVLRILRLAARVGALDGFAPAVPEPPAAEDGPALAREVASAGTVLVRNTGELPWAAGGPRSLAVIGHNAFVPRIQGGGSATVEPDRAVSPLDGLRAALPGTRVTWHLGAVAQLGIEPFAGSDLTDPVTGRPGVRLVCRAADGTVVLDEHRRDANLARLGSARLARTATVELTTRHLPAQSGPVRIGVAGAGNLRLTVDGTELLREELVHTGEEFGGGLVAPPHASVPVELAAGVPVDLAVRLDLPARAHPDAGVTLVAGLDLDTGAPDADIAAAAEAARGADAAVVVVGTAPEVESEGFDRTSLALPGRQDDLVRAVAAANPRTVAVVNAGAPVLLPWRDDVAAVLLTWFGGQEYGHALADVLLGAVEPGGRLPTTWPAAEADVPVLSTAPTAGRLPYDEGVHVGYRGWLASGAAPAYPFGHGLGYTTWARPTVGAPAATRAGDDLELAVGVRNTGRRAGKQVVQAYLSRTDSAVERPVRWLAGHAAVTAEPGETAAAVLTIPARAFQHFDGAWVTEPGDYRVHVGFSSADLPVTRTVRIR
ncbi:glycoside hydrolase family 3 C-terminal domain-containing protein [Streptomyces sp. WMMC500]|uniref:beta-glucosidase family protein n=1 Tax=Streptomyces sp. WMMC500 TaxID=3015154 RepID=UPI00248AEFDD|nr:glycoside hydrolase family 3 C-terminal domain-containing protein [Streptomyces sp. WMMC500]WBB61771.1 glycoside hydrolase family 3 C-terminal domain-containing protein [Streptomyces sp. WMMC500]